MPAIFETINAIGKMITEDKIIFFLKSFFSFIKNETAIAIIIKYKYFAEKIINAFNIMMQSYHEFKISSQLAAASGVDMEKEGINFYKDKIDLKKYLFKIMVK